MKNILVVVLFLLVLSLSCNYLTQTSQKQPPAITPANTLPSQAFSSPTPISSTNTPRAPAEHHIAVRVVNGAGEFYHRLSGQKFIPRGMNYIRLAWQTKEDGSKTFGHSLFDPGQYDSVKVGAELEKMHHDGYNVVRLFLSPDTMGIPGNGLSSAYLNNVVDVLNHAKRYEMYVIFTLDWIPGGIYGEILSRQCCDTFALMNANFLPQSGLEANQRFYQDFIRELIRLGAPTEYIFSYQLRNEMFYDSDQPPLSFDLGTVTTANGNTYDMSSKADKLLMVEENNLYWLDQMRAGILDVDPTALVSVGLFVPQEPHPARLGDPRFVVSKPAIWESSLDFVDLHAYPGGEINLKQIVENFGINGMQEKPIIMGEFGGEVNRYPSIFAAAQVFIDWQVESCKYGFDGWLFWTWDLTEQPDFYNAQMQEGAINGVLAPVLRSDPCVP